MLFKVPIGMSRFGCGTVTLPFFVRCLNCLWLPTCFTSCQPSFWICFMTSRLRMFPRVIYITTIHTLYTLVNIKIHILPHSRTPLAQAYPEWIAALDKIESLNPRAVIAGHKRSGNDNSPKIIEETRQYIRDFDRVAGTATTARGLYDKMLELYPYRVNPGGALWLSARAVNRNVHAEKEK